MSAAVAFPSAPAAAGSWTPALTFASPGTPTIAYSTQIGAYVRIADLVFARFNIVTSTFTHSASGNLRVTGLPFTVKNVSGDYQAGPLSHFGGISMAGYTQFGPVAVPNTVYCEIWASGSGQSPSAVGASQAATGGTITLRGLAIYQV